MILGQIIWSGGLRDNCKLNKRTVFLLLVTSHPPIARGRTGARRRHGRVWKGHPGTMRRRPGKRRAD